MARRKMSFIIFCIMFGIFIFIGSYAIANTYRDQEKTIVINDDGEADIKNIKFDVVDSVNIFTLEMDTYGRLIGWNGDKLLYQNVNPFFKIQDSKFISFVKGDSTVNDNAIYMIDPDSGEYELFMETGLYNTIYTIASPDQTKILFYEAYQIFGGDNEAIIEAEKAKEKGQPFVVENYNFVNSRIRVYDINTQTFTHIDEWEPKYYLEYLNNDKNTVNSDFSGVAWSVDGNAVVYCRRTTTGELAFFVHDLHTQKNEKYLFNYSEEDIQFISVSSISRDLKTLWIRCVINSIEQNKCIIYSIDLDNLNKGLKKVCDNIYNDAYINGEDIIYSSFGDLKYSSRINKYDMSAGQGFLIAENAEHISFNVFWPGNDLAYAISSIDGHDIYMVSLDNENEKNLIYKLDSDVWGVYNIYFNDDGKRIAIECIHYKDYTKKICILNLK